MNPQNIHMVSAVSESPCQLIMDNEIKGTRVLLHNLNPDQILHLEACSGIVRVMLLCKGSVEFCSNGNATLLADLGVYVAAPSAGLTATAVGGCRLLELQLDLEPAEYEQVCTTLSTPYALEYEKAKKYAEDCKSAKTVSRMLIPPRVVPRFSMGSVQTGGDDTVAPHSHPMVEQYFFGLAENNCTVTADDTSVPFGGCTLLHIPLGSEHGILSKGSQIVHYIWMDLLLDESALEYMDSAHQIIDE